MMAFSSTSTVPKRVLSKVSWVGMGRRAPRGEGVSRSLIGSAEEIHERRLHDVRAGAQGGLVRRLLRVHLDQGPAHVDVLRLGELRHGGELELGQARLRAL